MLEHALQNAPYFHLFRNLQKSQMPQFVSPSLRKAVANYVCKLYRGEFNPHNVDHLRMDIFSHKMRDVDRLSPISDALH